jgi:gamma-glutamyltranspeptidase
MSLDWHNPYPTVRSPVFARNVVSTSHPLASQAGLRMLSRRDRCQPRRPRHGERRLDDGRQQPQAACDAPRWKVATGRAIDFERTMAPGLVAGLRALGHEAEATLDPTMDFGSGQFIRRLSDDPADGYVAASDSRRDGQAVGF